MYEISFAIKDLDGAHEMGVLADDLTHDRVDELILDLPNTWRRDNVALLIRDQTTKILESVVFIYVYKTDDPEIVVFRDHQVAYPKSWDTSLDFRTHKKYDNLNSAQYLAKVDYFIDEELLKKIYMPYFIQISSEIKIPSIKKVFDFMIEASTQENISKSLQDANSLSRVFSPEQKTREFAKLMYDYLWFFHHISIPRGSQSLLVMRANFVVLLDDVNPRLMDDFASSHKNNISFTEFMYGCWGTTAFDYVFGRDTSEKAKYDKQKFFFDR